MDPRKEMQDSEKKGLRKGRRWFKEPGEDADLWERRCGWGGGPKNLSGRRRATKGKKADPGPKRANGEKKRKTGSQLEGQRKSNKRILWTTETRRRKQRGEQRNPPRLKTNGPGHFQRRKKDGALKKS